MPRDNPLTNRYSTQKADAKRRGIEWLFDYETWLKVWQDSGKLHLRGLGHGKYVMGRNGDRGPYSPGNVSIIPWEENLRQQTVNYPNPTPMGSGKGWCYQPALNKKRPYVVRFGRKTIGYFATKEEAGSAYRTAVAEELRRRASTQEEVGSDVRQDHAPHFSTHI